VRKLIALHGIKAKAKKKYKATTDSKHNLPVAPNLLGRRFAVDVPNRVWTSDITHIATDEGWLYLATVIDLFSRQIVGWSMQSRIKTELVIDALRMAWFRRHPKPGLIVHSDRGSQYCCAEFQAALAAYGMRSSMSRKGDCLGQRAHRKPVGFVEGGASARRAVRDSSRGDGRGDRLDELLQSSQAAFDAGLRQSNAVRAALARRSGKAGRMTDSAMGRGKQGQGQIAILD